MSKTVLIALTFVFSVAAGPASAITWQVDLDPERTEVSFRLKATMHTVHGTAILASG